MEREITGYRDIVILANSRRHDGRCIAGKDLVTGEWIRPINILGKGKPRLDQSAFMGEDFASLSMPKSGPQLLDCVRIGFDKPCGDYCQPENILIDGNKWTGRSRFPRERISELIDCSSCCFIGKGDCYSDYYPAAALKKNPLKSSLTFIRITKDKNKSEIIHTTSKMGKPQNRLKFEYGSRPYNLVITDKTYEDSVVLSQNDDSKIFEDCYISIGVGEVFSLGDTLLHYRLIVGIIPA